MSVPETYPEEADVEAVIEEFGGDARAALRAVLHDLAVLAADYESCVSKGFVRGRLAGQKPGAVAPFPTDSRPSATNSEATLKGMG
jgi:hypothetical protein